MSIISSKCISVKQLQHGFRNGYNTQNALHSITNLIQRGLNRRRPNYRSVLVVLDMTSAFDTVDHSILITQLAKLTMPPSVARWVNNYLCEDNYMFRNKRSKCHKAKQGKPTGSLHLVCIQNVLVIILETNVDVNCPFP